MCLGYCWYSCSSSMRCFAAESIYIDRIFRLPHRERERGRREGGFLADVPTRERELLPDCDPRAMRQAGKAQPKFAIPIYLYIRTLYTHAIGISEIPRFFFRQAAIVGIYTRERTKEMKRYSFNTHTPQRCENLFLTSRSSLYMYTSAASSLAHTQSTVVALITALGHVTICPRNPRDALHCTCIHSTCSTIASCAHPHLSRLIRQPFLFFSLSLSPSLTVSRASFDNHIAALARENGTRKRPLARSVAMLARNCTVKTTSLHACAPVAWTEREREWLPRLSHALSIAQRERKRERERESGLAREPSVCAKAPVVLSS